MIARAGSGWQTVLADLSLILFMVTASVLAATPSATSDAEHSEQSEPLAIFVPAGGPPSLHEWIVEQSPDERQQLTIVAQYPPGEQASALTRAETMLQEAGRAGIRARIVIEPGPGGISAVLAYDAPRLTLAQGLLEGVKSPQASKDQP